MLRDRQEILAAVAAYFRDRDEVKIVLVFGSVAADRHGDASDVDVAIAGDRAFASSETVGMGTELALILGRPVDIVDLIASEGLIRKSALSGGVRLKVEDELYARIHSRLLVWVEDFLPLKRTIQEVGIRRFCHGS